MKKTYLILLIIFIISSCKKDDDINNINQTGWVKFKNTIVKTSYSWDVNIIRKDNILLCDFGYRLINLNNENKEVTYKDFTDVSVYYDENSSRFNGLFSLDNNVWLVGNTCIYGSIDYGKSWTKIYQDANTFFTKVFFIDKNYGYAIGRNLNENKDCGVVYKTTNGGVCWECVLTIHENNYSSIFRDVCINNGTVWVIGEKWGDGLPSSTLVYTSNDEGLTWTNNNNITSLFNYSFVNTIQFVDEKGWISGYEEIIYTSDGGLTWNNIAVPNTGYINDFVFVDKNVGWAACDYGVFHTIDGGFNWTKQLSPSSDDNEMFYCIDFLNKDFGIVAGANGAVYVTSDGGG
jgi:photosystem II stability/assembly factor-like uncharacterized protein